ncbi:MAG: amidohydrolase family protein [Candidatus Azambacteria bacterium]|nr:amidohydrolase family protein [Candidatus Azambacteria bacterium]
MGEKGFSQIFLIVFIVGALAAIGGGTWYYLQTVKQEVETPPQVKKQEQPKTAEEPKPAEKPAVQKETPKAVVVQPPQAPPPPVPAPCDITLRPRQFSSTPYYTGPLFDAHIHLPGLPDINKLLCTFDKEKVKGAIGFYWSPSQSLEKMLAETTSIKNDSSGKIRIFLMPKSYSLKTLEDIETTKKSLLAGYGELAFYNRGDPSQSYYPQIPDEQQFLDLYVLAGKNNLVVMIHPNQGQAGAIENVIQKNPNVKFYFHGEEIESAIIGLMDKYPNVYYSIDATLSRLPYSGDTLHVSLTEESYVSRIKQNFTAMLNGAVNDWKAKIEKHPDKFTWGTDRGGFSWHYGEEVSRLFEELSRSFIGRLDPAVQEKYAYKNAESLLQK